MYTVIYIIISPFISRFHWYKSIPTQSRCQGGPVPRSWVFRTKAALVKEMSRALVWRLGSNVEHSNRECRKGPHNESSFSGARYISLYISNLKYNLYKKKRGYPEEIRRLQKGLHHHHVLPFQIRPTGRNMISTCIIICLPHKKIIPQKYSVT